MEGYKIYLSMFPICFYCMPKYLGASEPKLLLASAKLLGQAVPASNGAPPESSPAVLPSVQCV